MAVVIETLREDHRNIARLLDALEHQIEVFAQAGAPDYDVVGGIAAYFLEYPDKCHHPKEDVVFKRLIHVAAKEASDIGNLLGEHKIVHDRAVRFGDAIRDLLNESDIARSTVVDAAREFIEAERRHMQKEEQHFLPLAEQVLSSADWSQIELELAGGRDPLFGERAEERFKNVRERLLAWEQEFRTGEELDQ
jgi:hemerythrin-like domain-containing protein